MSIFKRSAMALDETALIKPLRLIEEKAMGKFGAEDRWECEVNGQQMLVYSGYYAKQGAAKNSQTPADYDNPDALGQHLRKATQIPSGVLSMGKFFDAAKGKAAYTYTVLQGKTTIPGTHVPDPTTSNIPHPPPPAHTVAQASTPLHNTPPEQKPIQTAEDYEADRAKYAKEKSGREDMRSIQIIRQSVLKTIHPPEPVGVDNLKLIREEADYWVDWVLGDYQPKLPGILHRHIEALINEKLKGHREEFKGFLVLNGWNEIAAGGKFHLNRLTIEHAQKLIDKFDQTAKSFMDTIAPAANKDQPPAPAVHEDPGMPF